MLIIYNSYYFSKLKKEKKKERGKNRKGRYREGHD